VTCDEFIVFLRACNPRDDGPDGWRVMLPDEVAAVEGGDDQGFDAKAHEQTAMLAVHRRLEGTKGADKQRWRPVTQADVTKPQRGRDGGGKQPPTELAVKRVDLHNAQAMIDTLRGLRMSDAQVATVVSAIFVEKTAEAYAKVFDIFDTDSTGGIDQHEFHQITALLGNHASEAETRALFLSADTDCNGLLDVAEFTALLRSLSPAARSDDAHYVRTLQARERLQQRIAELDRIKAASAGGGAGGSEEAGADATLTCRVLVLGASRAGKTHLLNQIVSEKLPKGKTLTVGFSAVQMRVGQATVAIQLLDTPGDPKFAPLAKVFHGVANFCLLVFDATSVASFEAIEALRIEFLEANPQYDAGRLLVVANTARSDTRTIDRFAEAQTLTRTLALAPDHMHVSGAHGHQARHLERLRARLVRESRLDRLLRGGRGGGAGAARPDATRRPGVPRRLPQ